MAIDDFLDLSRNFNRSGVDWTEGDFDGDGRVDVRDFLDLSRNFGTIARASVAVPEPSSSLLAAMSLGVAMLFRHRR